MVRYTLKLRRQKNVERFIAVRLSSSIPANALLTSPIALSWLSPTCASILMFRLTKKEVVFKCLCWRWKAFFFTVLLYLLSSTNTNVIDDDDDWGCTSCFAICGVSVCVGLCMHAVQRISRFSSSAEIQCSRSLVSVRFHKQAGVGGVRGNRTGDVFCLACQSISL